MKEEKWWVVSYSVKWKDGHIDEVQTKIKAFSIGDAVDQAKDKIYQSWIEIPDAELIVIWDVGLLMGEPVF